jgi:hypothetical protein
MATKLELKTAEVTEKRGRLGKFFDDHKKPEGFTFSAAQVDEVKALNTELDALGKEVAELRELDAIEVKNREAIEALNTPNRNVPFASGGAGGGAGRIDTKGMGSDGFSHPARVEVGRLFVESKGFKNRQAGVPLAASFPDLEVKTLFQTSAGWSPFVPRIPTVALSPQQQPRVIDVFPTGTTASAAIKFMQETTFTNAAAGVAEAGAYPESALQLTELTQNVIKLATFLPVTDEQLEDVEGTRDYVDGRLGLMMGQLLDNQLTTGSGAGSNLTGLANIAGIQNVAKVAGDATTDALLKAIVGVQTIGFAQPSAIVMNPTDWMNVRLLKTADGIYIWGHPSANGPATMWGLPVVASTFVTLGTSYTGDYMGQTQVFYRRGLEFLVTNSNNDDFTKGRQCIRCDMRVVLVCFRPSAIRKTTGL